MVNVDVNGNSKTLIHRKILRKTQKNDNGPSPVTYTTISRN